MTDFDELGPQAKQALSWIALGELLNIKHLKGCVGITHPGGGQYDCLNFFGSTGSILLSINRNGSSVTGMNKKGEFGIRDFWETASCNPRSAAQLIAKEMTSADFSEPDNHRMVQGFTVNRIAAWLLLNLNRSERARADWAWYDSSDWVGLSAAFSNYLIPDLWKTLPPPFPHEMWGDDGWAGNIFFLELKGKDICAVNLLTGEAIKPDGSAWDKWPQLAPRGEGESVILAELITASYPNGEVLNSTLVLPSDRRRFIKHYSQEFIGAEFTSEPFFELEAENYDELIKIWRLAERYSPGADTFGGYLD